MHDAEELLCDLSYYAVTISDYRVYRPMVGVLMNK
jgi:hypothetical protein